MGELTKSVPKPLLLIAGRPLLDHLLDRLAGLAGLGEIHLVSNRASLRHFETWAGARAASGLEVRVWDNGCDRPDRRPGAIRDLERLWRHAGRPERALVAAGDNIFLFPLAPFWRRFLEIEENLVLALHEPDLEERRRSGVLELDVDGRVLALYEKPVRPPSSWVCPALYGFQRSGFLKLAEFLEGERAGDDLGRLIAYLIERETVMAFRVKGHRLHVGSRDSYRKAELYFADGAVSG